MPPENVRSPSTTRATNYIMNTLRKCYDSPPKSSEVKEARTLKDGFRKYYLCKSTGLYRGWWKDNMRHGLGKQTFNNKSEIYEGEFRENECSGYGVLSNVKVNGVQELLYEGYFANGAPNGQGDLHTDSYHYSGSVYNGKASGFGIAWYKNGQIYIGSWFNGKRMGQGAEVHRNKNRYEGNWYDDKKHGYGQYTFFKRGRALEGIWVADVCVRGTMRNIKYRQAAEDPVRYAIPPLKLKNWTSVYWLWEKKSLARVGKYVREDIGLRYNKKEGGRVDIERQLKENIEREDVAHQIKLLDLEQYTKYLPGMTEVQPFVIFS